MENLLKLTLNQKKFLGNDLLSRGVAPQVPSALTALTSGFEMCPGVPLSLLSPRNFSFQIVCVVLQKKEPVLRIT